MFGRNLYDQYKYPIGLIESNWGGTPIEVWSSPDATAACANNGRKRYVPHNYNLNTIVSLAADPFFSS